MKRRRNRWYVAEEKTGGVAARRQAFSKCYKAVLSSRDHRHEALSTCEIIRIGALYNSEQWWMVVPGSHESTWLKRESIFCASIYVSWTATNLLTYWRNRKIKIALVSFAWYSRAYTPEQSFVFELYCYRKTRRRSKCDLMQLMVTAIITKCTFSIQEDLFLWSSVVAVFFHDFFFRLTTVPF